MLRRKGVRVVSITEHADDTPTGKLMEAIIESVDEFYSENLAQEVTRGMRESASRGFWVTSYAPFGYNRVMVQDGPKKRPTLEPDPDASRVVKRIFDMAEAGNGMTLNITNTLNERGHRQPQGEAVGQDQRLCHPHQRGLHRNSWSGAANAKDNAEPVRVEQAFPAIITKVQFSKRRQADAVPCSQAGPIPEESEAPTCSAVWSSARRAAGRSPARTPRAASSAYYVCQSIMKRGKDACVTLPDSTPAASSRSIVDKIRSNILTEGSITELVRAVDEEMDGIAQRAAQEASNRRG